MPLRPFKANDKDGCRNCSYVLGGGLAQVGMHCGFRYYQQPARERRPEKLSNFPSVKAEQVCPNWSPKDTTKLDQLGFA